MKRGNTTSFKNARKREVNDYLGLITPHNISYSKLDFKENLPDDLWGYHIDGLRIPIDINTIRHMRPTGFSSAEIIVDLDIESKISEWSNLNDPFTQLSFRTLLKGVNKITNKNHYLNFHIDRHNGTETKEIHPLYHLQYLQNAKNKEKDDFCHGDSLQLDIPRMMHFPMELILGVSFVLSNFSPEIYSKLIQERGYHKLSKEYQEKVWRPYINSLNDFWTAQPNNWVWNPRLNCPFFL